MREKKIGLSLKQTRFVYIVHTKSTQVSAEYSH